jgi:hypothetical protein
VPYSIWRLTASLQVPSSRLLLGVYITSEGIRYSNIEPDHDSSIAPSSTGSSGRPSLNQCETGTSPFAMAMKLNSRASEASRS